MRGTFAVFGKYAKTAMWYFLLLESTQKRRYGTFAAFGKYAKNDDMVLDEEKNRLKKCRYGTWLMEKRVKKCKDGTWIFTVSKASIFAIRDGRF